LEAQSQIFDYMSHIKILRFLNEQTFMDFLMLIFVISTPDSIDKHRFYLNQKKKILWYLRGTPGTKNFFSSFFRTDHQIKIRIHVQLHSNKKIPNSVGGEKITLSALVLCFFFGNGFFEIQRQREYHRKNQLFPRASNIPTLTLIFQVKV